MRKKATNASYVDKKSISVKSELKSGWIWDQPILKTLGDGASAAFNGMTGHYTSAAHNTAGV